MDPDRRSPFYGVVERFFIVAAVLTVLLVIVLALPFSTIIPKKLTWSDTPLPPDAIAACVSEIDSPDKTVRLHARTVLAQVALECPTIADLLAPSIARLLDDEDLRVRASTVEVLGRLGPPASQCEAQIEALRGTSVPHLDHTIDIALAGLRREVSPPEDHRVFCSILTREAVQAAIGTSIPATRKEAHRSRQSESAACRLAPE